MHHYLFDILFILIAGGVSLMLSKRSLVQVAVVFFALVVSSLLALIGFEPVAKFVASYLFLPSDEWLYCYAWLVSALGIFTLSMLLVMLGCANLMDATSFITGKAEAISRWTLSLLAGYTFAAFLLTTVHTFPGNRELAGLLPPELHRRQGPVLRFGPDYQLLTLAELVCTPRSPLTGTPWQLEGPLVEADLESNRWSSFPIRYALWREGVIVKLYGEDLPDEGDEENYY